MPGHQPPNTPNTNPNTLESERRTKQRTQTRVPRTTNTVHCQPWWWVMMNHEDSWWFMITGDDWWSLMNDPWRKGSFIPTGNQGWTCVYVDEWSRGMMRSNNTYFLMATDFQIIPVNILSYDKGSWHHTRQYTFLWQRILKAFQAIYPYSRNRDSLRHIPITPLIWNNQYSR